MGTCSGTVRALLGSVFFSECSLKQMQLLIGGSRSVTEALFCPIRCEVVQDWNQVAPVKRKDQTFNRESKLSIEKSEFFGIVLVYYKLIDLEAQNSSQLCFTCMYISPTWMWRMNNMCFEVLKKARLVHKHKFSNSKMTLKWNQNGND